MPRPQTIQIFLPDGEPRGLRMADITTRIVQVLAVPRTKLLAVTRPELGRVGLYFLFGEADETSKPSVYIGQAENCLVRIKQHNLSKDFWNIGLVVVSKTENLTKSHVRYLEWLSITRAKAAGRYIVQNASVPNEPFVTEPQAAELEEIFETCSTLLSALGFPAFQPLASVSTEARFFYEPKKAAASGEYTDDGFVVFAGSTANGEEYPSTSAWISNMRRLLVESGVLVPEGEMLRFEVDHLFNSPSAAAATVRGHNVSGWEAWRDSEGRTLDMLFRNRE